MEALERQVARALLAFADDARLDPIVNAHDLDIRRATRRRGPGEHVDLLLSDGSKITLTVEHGPA